MLKQLIEKQNEELQHIKRLLFEILDIYEETLRRLEAGNKEYQYGESFGKFHSNDYNSSSVVSVYTAINYYDVDPTNIN